MKRKPYPSDVTDQQWALIEPLFPRPGRRPRPGRPREVDLREVVNALFYHAREGCSWRALPHDFPTWDCVYHYFREWSADGTWQRIDPRCPSPPGPRPGRAGADAQRGGDRQPIGQDGAGWQGTGHRRRQEGQGP